MCSKLLVKPVISIPQKNIDHSVNHIERLSLMGSEIVRILYKRDQAAQ
jgi:4-hydroxy-3-methylbut-2-en-1-yl diphosphate synthase IspG/GcpE